MENISTEYIINLNYSFVSDSVLTKNCMYDLLETLHIHISHYVTEVKNRR